MMTLQAPSGLGAALGSPLVMMAIVMGIFYVMLILPQQRQRKKLQAMLSALKAGDKNRRHRFVSGKNSHRAFGNYAGGGIGRCEISPPAFR